MIVMVASFVAFLVLFTVIGVASARHRAETPDDYLLAGRSVPPWLTALSSVATNNSGYMFIGQIGFAYEVGLRSVWLALGWIVGDLMAWAFVHRRVRERSGELDARSVPSLLGARDGRGRAIVIVAALLTLVFLGVYAAAQLKAGSKSLHVLFGWNETVGAVLGAVIVVVYCFSGGIRASIWTDAAQSMVMLVAMAGLLVYAFVAVGGPAELGARLWAIDPALVRLVASDGSYLELGLWTLGWVGGGLGVIGQPHILVRTMALDSPKSVPRTGAIYFAWFVPFYAMAIGIALYARVLLPSLSDAELALPSLASELMPPVLVGVVLAGLFSATMSTADSQILACSAAITHDLWPRLGESYLANKLGTLGIAALALGIALFAGSGVFELVLYAWAALAVTIGPVLLVRIGGGAPAGWVGVAMMATGLVTMFVWRGLGWAAAVYEILPGIVAALAVFALTRPVDRTEPVPVVVAEPAPRGSRAAR
jgi:sodium/proline symporter